MAKLFETEIFNLYNFYNEAIFTVQETILDYIINMIL